MTLKVLLLAKNLVIIKERNKMVFVLKLSQRGNVEPPPLIIYSKDRKEGVGG